MRIRWPKTFHAVLCALTIFGLVVSGLFRFTAICELEAVTLDGAEVSDWQNEYGLIAGRHLFEQPIDSVARALLSRGDIVKVDMDFDLPNRLNIRTNVFSLACFVVDDNSGTLRGLSADSRVISVNHDQDNWEHPVLTGVARAPLHGYCSDPRVPKVMAELRRLRDKQTDLYRLINEIDFGRTTYLRLSFSGLPYQLLLRSDQLFERVTEFILFLERFGPDTRTARAFDLRFDKMIVEVGVAK